MFKKNWRFILANQMKVILILWILPGIEIVKLVSENCQLLNKSKMFVLIVLLLLVLVVFIILKLFDSINFLSQRPNTICPFLLNIILFLHRVSWFGFTSAKKSGFSLCALLITKTCIQKSSCNI